jgi:hypothetical protein
MFVIQILLTAGVLAIAFLVYRITQEMRTMRCSIEMLAESLAHGGKSPVIGGHCICAGLPLAKYFVIWVWSGTEWELDHGSIPNHVDPGSPPQFPGSYLGQCVRTECR